MLLSDIFTIYLCFLYHQFATILLHTHEDTLLHHGGQRRIQTSKFAHGRSLSPRVDASVCDSHILILKTIAAVIMIIWKQEMVSLLLHHWYVHFGCKSIRTVDSKWRYKCYRPFPSIKQTVFSIQPIPQIKHVWLKKNSSFLCLFT